MTDERRVAIKTMCFLKFDIVIWLSDFRQSAMRNAIFSYPLT